MEIINKFVDHLINHYKELNWKESDIPSMMLKEEAKKFLEKLKMSPKGEAQRSHILVLSDDFCGNKNQGEKDGYIYAKLYNIFTISTTGRALCLTCNFYFYQCAIKGTSNMTDKCEMYEFKKQKQGKISS